MPKDGDNNRERGFMQKVDDANVTAKVKSQLLWNSSTDGLDITVETRNGVVMLSGYVKSDAESQLAEQIARNTSDVRDVRNQLQVDKQKVPLDVAAERKTEQAAQRITDGWITTKVKSALLYNRTVDGTDINVDTEEGVVTLQGHVDSDFERKQAISIASSVKGVKSVKANLEGS
jgi:osmotically-inducible protein OsmY